MEQRAFQPLSECLFGFSARLANDHAVKMYGTTGGVVDMD